MGIILFFKFAFRLIMFVDLFLNKYSDFVNEPVKGLKRSVEERNPAFVVDGVARGTGSLARHAVSGIADTASLLTDTFSKNMAVLTLDRNYAQRRDRFKTLHGNTTSFVEGVESGVLKLIRGVVEGVIGVVRAPILGAERRGMEGFAKGVGKGLLGLLVKPVIGLSDAATDVMIGVKGSVEGTKNDSVELLIHQQQIRPRRTFYGNDRVLRIFNVADATASFLMERTCIAGEKYLSHFDMGDRVALLSVKKFLLLDVDGKQILLIKYKQIRDITVREVLKDGSSTDWEILIYLKSPRKNGREVEIVNFSQKSDAISLSTKLKQGWELSREVE